MFFFVSSVWVKINAARWRGADQRAAAPPQHLIQTDLTVTDHGGRGFCGLGGASDINPEVRWGRGVTAEVKRELMEEKDGGRWEMVQKAVPLVSASICYVMFNLQQCIMVYRSSCSLLSALCPGGFLKTYSAEQQRAALHPSLSHSVHL